MSFRYLARPKLRLVNANFHDSHHITNSCYLLQSLKENVAAAQIRLTDEEIAEVRHIAESAEASKTGERYPPGMAEQLFIDTPALEK